MEGLLHKGPTSSSFVRPNQEYLKKKLSGRERPPSLKYEEGKEDSNRPGAQSMPIKRRKLRT